MPATVRFGTIEIQPVARRVLAAGVPATLGARAFDLLLALIERRDRVVTKHELMDIVWPDQVVEEGNLHVQVSTLRKLLGPSAITTIPGRGYRFVVPLDDVVTQAPADPPPSQPAARLPGNLGTHRAPLLGRETELPALLALLEARRLVTIVGASGMGKTALAQVAAQALRGRWRDGAWWVDLAPVTDPAQLPQVVAQTLQIAGPARPQRGSTARHLESVLASMSLLLVLDNCEHLIEAAGAFAERLVQHAGGVHVLATSQELLNVADEVVFKLTPLALPAADASPDEAGGCGAVRLFVERARSADDRFTLDGQNVQAVSDICRRLDGLPLAIELAAARVRLLGVQSLRDKLGERFRVLTGGARTAMRRHQTLRAALDWSHGLLSAPEQRVFRRLGVFVGGFALDLAQALAQDGGIDEWAVLDALGALVDKSLVSADAAEPPRYRLLETTRAYALEMLAEAGETDAWIARHAQVMCNFFEQQEEARRGEQATLSNGAYIRRTAPELDNARAALDWACAEAGDLNLAVGLAGASALAFNNLSFTVETLDRLMDLRPHIDDRVAPLRAALLWHSLAGLGQSGRIPLAVALDAADRAEQCWRGQGLAIRQHSALALKALLLTLAGDGPSAQALLVLMRQLETPAWPVWRMGLRLRAQAWIQLTQGELEAALVECRQWRALMLNATGETRTLIDSESELSRCLYLTGRHDECIALVRAVIAREGGALRGRLPLLAQYLMVAQATSGRLEDARQTLVEALPAWRRNGMFAASAALALVLAELGSTADAARVGAAAIVYLKRADIVRHPSLQHMNERWQALLASTARLPNDVARWQREGEALDEAAIEAICLRAVQSFQGDGLTPEFDGAG